MTRDRADTLSDRWYARVVILRELGVDSILARDALMSCIADLREVARGFYFEETHMSLNRKSNPDQAVVVLSDREIITARDALQHAVQWHNSDCHVCRVSFASDIDPKCARMHEYRRLDRRLADRLSGD